MKTTMKIAVIAMMGMGFGVKAQNEAINGNLTVKGSLSSQGSSHTFSTESGKTNFRLTFNMLDAENAYLYNYNHTAQTFHTVNVGGSHSLASGLTILGNSNVGIGTANPSSKLDIRGTERAQLRIYKNGLDDKYLSFWHGTSGAVIEPIRTNGSKANMFLGGYDYPTDVLIASRKPGNVGIGTTSPRNKLHVFGNTGIRVVGNGTDQIFLEGERTGSTNFRLYDNKSNIYYDSRSNMTFRANQLGGSNGSINLMGGNVGIGTASPSGKLQVNRVTSNGELSKNAINSFINTTANSNVTSYDKGAYVFAGNYSIAQGAKDSGYKIAVDASSYANTTNFKGTLRSNYGIWARAGIYRGTSGAKIENAVAVEAQILDNVEGTSIDNVYGVRISTNNYKKSSVINRYDLYAGTSTAKNYFAGKVGVGTKAPDMELTVNGKIHAKEVKIDLAVPAPDYVFKSEYNLRSIEEVESFIKEHSHLPEIPSAKEFAENGVMQAEMDMNLLKKIEELTLYTITQEKKLKSQEKRFFQQQKEIEELKKQNSEIKELKALVEKLLKDKN
ncbi:hypothetical protein [Tenacibaculum sp. C7A-26P2]|uniref:hypothetical protein n=1 Tax=Tenacibaculum sp. C7A-26P2 TaxID=3447504 RepID=UPI003F877D4F